MKRILLMLLIVLIITNCLGQAIDMTTKPDKDVIKSEVSSTTHDLLIGVSSGVLASFIFAFVIGLVSKRARWILTGILGRVTNSDIEYVYSNKKDSENDLKSELNRTSKVYIFTSRGNEFKRDVFESLFKHKPQNRKVDMRILLPKIICCADEIDWVDIREKEISTFDKAYGNGQLKREIENNLEYLKQYSTDGVLVQHYSYPHIGRIIITDNCVFYSPYSKSTHGSSDPVFKYRRGATYNNYYRMFDLIWQNDK